jgi:hypothetical protein
MNNNSTLTFRHLENYQIVRTNNKTNTARQIKIKINKIKQKPQKKRTNQCVGVCRNYQ